MERTPAELDRIIQAVLDHANVVSSTGQVLVDIEVELDDQEQTRKDLQETLDKQELS